MKIGLPYPLVYNGRIGSDHILALGIPAYCGGSLRELQGQGSRTETAGPPVLYFWLRKTAQSGSLVLGKEPGNARGVVPPSYVPCNDWVILRYLLRGFPD